MKINQLLATIFLIALIGGCMPIKSSGQGILLSEYRLIFDTNKLKTLQVCNPTDEVRSFNISVVDKKMNEYGKFAEVVDTLELSGSLKKYLRVYPKTIRLAPNECQEIQIQVKGTSALADGEYRSYLYLLPLLANEVESDDSIASEDRGVQLGVAFRVATAAPILFRKNSTLEEVRIDSVETTVDARGKASLHFIIERKGSQSTFGTIIVERMVNGEATVLVARSGNAIYADMERRRFLFPITKEKISPDENTLSTIRIKYIDDEDKDKPTILAEKQVEVSL